MSSVRFFEEGSPCKLSDSIGACATWCNGGERGSDGPHTSPAFVPTLALTKVFAVAFCFLVESYIFEL